jgi:hypothetical protein
MSQGYRVDILWRSRVSTGGRFRDGSELPNVGATARRATRGSNRPPDLGASGEAAVEDFAALFFRARKLLLSAAFGTWQRRPGGSAGLDRNFQVEIVHLEALARRFAPLMSRNHKPHSSGTDDGAEDPEWARRDSNARPLAPEAPEASDGERPSA